MSPVLGFLSVISVLASFATALPATADTQRVTFQQVFNASRYADQLFLLNNPCAGQSCIAADAAGSSGKPPKSLPEGGGPGDVACIAKYNPEFAAWMKSHNNNPPKVPKQDTGISSSLLGGINSIWQPFTDGLGGSTDKGTFDGKCAPNILIFAKGTFEPGGFGMLVGPSFTSGLPSGWETVGVSYDPNVPGDYCLGLPGGMVARDMINQAAQKCPSSNLFVSGYSQGAMVARNGVAYADASAKSHVKGIVTFGDPFQGSAVKGWNGPISTFCNRGDYVCTGNFELAPSHISYGFDSSAGLGQTALLNMAKKAKSGRGSRRRWTSFFRF